MTVTVSLSFVGPEEKKELEALSNEDFLYTFFNECSPDGRLEVS